MSVFPFDMFSAPPLQAATADVPSVVPGRCVALKRVYSIERPCRCPVRVVVGSLGASVVCPVWPFGLCFFVPAAVLFLVAAATSLGGCALSSSVCGGLFV